MLFLLRQYEICVFHFCLFCLFACTMGNTEVRKSGFNGIYLIATNPVDVMTYLTWKYSSLPTTHVLGTGTTLDTARLRYEVAKNIDISPKNIHAYVIGEHGDSEFVPWSNANVGLQNIRDFLDNDKLEEICNNVRNAAYEIINRKGNTSYGIGMSMVRITNAILENENLILTVSSYFSVSLSAVQRFFWIS